MCNATPVKMQWFKPVHIRTTWEDAAKKWWFSALDTVAALTDQPDYTKARNYWKWLMGKLKQEGSEVVSATHQMKLEAKMGKKMISPKSTKQLRGLSQAKRKKPEGRE